MNPPPDRDMRFERLIRPILQDLYRFAVRLTGDPIAAEDLVQQAVTTSLVKLHQLQHDAAFKVWVSRIVYRTHLNHTSQPRETLVKMEHLDNVVPIGGNRPSPADEAQHRQLGRSINHALDKLPEGQRDAVWLVDGQGFKYSEAAEILGITPGTAASRVARGREALRTSLKEVAHEQGVVR